MADQPNPTPPFVLSDAKVAHVKRDGDDWVPAPDEPARLQGKIGAGYPGVPEGETRSYTSSPVTFVAGIVFRTESDKLITVVWEDLTVEERKAFLPLLKLLLMKTRPAPQAAEEVADPDATPPEGTRIPPGLLTGDHPEGYVPPEGLPQTDPPPVREGDDPPPKT